MKIRDIWQSSLLLLLSFIFLPGCANPLLNAAGSGDLSKIESLIKDGQDLNQPALLGGTTALHMASAYGHLDIARLLINEGANIDIQDTTGATPLSWSVTFKKTDMARLLIESGARLDIQNQDGITALGWAAEKGNEDIVRLLIEKGANLDIRNQHGATILVFLSGTGKADMVRLFIENRARLDTQTKSGDTALHFAVENRNENIVQLLTESGARLDIQNEDGVTALHKAAQLGNAEIARLLIEHGANTNIRNRNGQTALDLALAVNSYTIADMLREPTTKNQPQRPGLQPENIIPTYKTYTGTGWVTEGGFIVTNHHVIEGHVQIVVRFNTLGGEEFPANVVLSDKFNDLAVLSIPFTNNSQPKGIPLASNNPRIGTEVFTIGYPKSEVMGVNPKVTNGIISSLSGIEDDPRVIQTTVAIQSGNSGGPLLTINGEAVGVITSTLRTKVTEKGIDVPQNVNYAVKSAYVAVLLKSLNPEPKYPMIPPSNTNLEELIPNLQDSIVQIIVKTQK